MRELFELITRRSEPSPPVLEGRGRRIEGLEAVRAIAALAVVTGHAFDFTLIDPTLVVPDVVQKLFFAHPSVLLFFLLSGYVIGLATTSRFSAAAARLYALKRTARLYPIFIVGLFLGWSLQGPLNVTEAIGNLFLLGGLKPYFGIGIYPPFTNQPLWSISYEAIYYAVFIAVWAWRPRWGIVFGIPAILALFSLPLKVVPPFLSSWSAGFLFWAVGLWLSWNAVRGATLKRPLLTWFLLLIATYEMGPLFLLAAKVFGNRPEWPKVNLTDIAFLPVCMLIVCDAAGIILKWRRIWVGLAFAIPAAGLAMWIGTKGLDLSDPTVQAPLGVMISAGAFYTLRGSLAHVRWLAWMGGCSYGIYAIHYPILHVFRDHFPWNGSRIVTAVGVIAFYATVIGLSYVLESSARKFFLDPLRKRNPKGVPVAAAAGAET
ncbi:acyltransferase [soil metagenome]